MKTYELKFSNNFEKDKELLRKSGNIQLLKKLAIILRELVVHPTARFLPQIICIQFNKQKWIVMKTSSINAGLLSYFGKDILSYFRRGVLELIPGFYNDKLIPP